MLRYPLTYVWRTEPYMVPVVGNVPDTTFPKFIRDAMPASALALATKGAIEE